MLSRRGNVTMAFETLLFEKVCYNYFHQKTRSEFLSPHKSVLGIVDYGLIKGDKV